jgi:4-amino-4-deoxy-L-arabinose transferase-like glycosyltransferase
VNKIDGIQPLGGGRRKLIVPGIALALFLVQILPLLSTRWVEDENWYSCLGYTFLKDGRIRNPTLSELEIESKVDMRPPGTAVVTAAAFQVLGMGPAQARTPSVLMGLGTILLVFCLGAELGGFWLGAAAAVVAAADNFMFLAARTVRPEAYVTFLGALACLLYFRARRKSSFWLALLSGASVGASVFFHPTGLALGAGLAAVSLWECKWRIVRDRIAWALLIGFLLALTPMVARVTLSDEHMQSFRLLYGRGHRAPWGALLASEQSRYSDFIGLSSQRFRLPIPVPLRLHIAMIVLAAFAVLYAKNRRLFWPLLFLLLANLLWWPFLLNNTPRYFSIVGPILAVAIVAAAITAWERWPKTAAAAVALFVLTQVAGNAVLLYRSRDADYGKLTAQLRAVIPPGRSVYAANTFWLALYDHTLWTFMRTSFDYSIVHMKPDYLILNDRVMMNGFGYGDDDFADLRQQANAFAKLHATQVSHIESPFYGNLDVYRVEYSTVPER